MDVLGQNRAREAQAGLKEDKQLIKGHQVTNPFSGFFFQLPVVDSMWVQMEWSCPQTTPRTIPVDRRACILSPCLRTTVGFPWLAFLFSDSSPVSSKMASPLWDLAGQPLRQSSIVSWHVTGGGFLARGERGAFRGMRVDMN